jgi:hypothetical protein
MDESESRRFYKGWAGGVAMGCGGGGEGKGRGRYQKPLNDGYPFGHQGFMLVVVMGWQVTIVGVRGEGDRGRVQ